LQDQWLGGGGLAGQHHWNSFLLHILIQFAGLSPPSLQKEVLSYPKMLRDLLKIADKKAMKETFRVIGEWWTLKQWTSGCSPSIRSVLFQWLSTKEWIAN